MDEIKKREFDPTKMPVNVKGDYARQVAWENTEKAEIEREYAEALKGQGEPPAKEEENNEENPKFSLDDFKDFGEFKTVDEIKEALKDRSLTKTERDDLKEELATAKTQLEAKPKSLITDPTLYRLNKIKGEKAEDFERYAKLMWGKTDAMTTLKEKFLRDNPEYKESPEIVESLIKSEYGLDKTVDPDDEEAVKQNKIAIARLEIAAKAAKKEILSELDKIEVPEAEIIDENKVKEANEKLTKQLREDWSVFKSGIEKEFQKFHIQIPQKDERGNIIKDKFIDFTDHIIPDDIRKRCADYAYEFAVINKMKPTKENVSAAWNELMKTFTWTNLPYIIDTAIELRATMDNETFHKTYNNPSGGKKETKGDKGNQGAKTEYQKAVESYLKK